MHALLLVGVEEASGCAVVVTDFEDGGASAGYDGVGGGDGFRGCGGGCYGLFQRSLSAVYFLKLENLGVK